MTCLFFLDKSKKGSEFKLGQGCFMKALKKIGFAVFAICMAFTAMSCKDDDDDSPAVVTEWIEAAEDDDPTRKIVCYEDKSFAVSVSEHTFVVGTYEGDTTKSDVTIKINVTKVAEGMLDNDSTSFKLVTFETTGTGTISKDGKTMDVIIKIDDKDCPFGTFTKK